MRADDILYFWFTEAGPKAWWQKSRDFDDLVRRRFLGVYEAARQGELCDWRATARGRLAEIIVLDQFPRNMFRDYARSFESDSLALVLAQEAVRGGALEQLPADWKAFLIMPYMHSESGQVHETAVQLFSKPELAYNLDFELRHKAIIDRFGRYPHRNEILGRKSSVAEMAFLQQPGSSF